MLRHERFWRGKARIGLVSQGPARQVGRVEVEQDLASLGLARRVGMRPGMAGGSWLVTVYSGRFRHGLARLGEVGQGKAGQVGSGKARRVAFFWDWIRQGRLGKARCVEFRLFRVGSGEDRQVRFEVARQRGARWGELRNGLVRQGRCGLVSNGEACRGFARNGLAGLV